MNNILQKTPGETKTFYIDFRPFFNGRPPMIPKRTDAVSAFTVTLPSGLTLVESSINGQIITFRVSGGTKGETYQCVTSVTTTVGDLEEYEFLIQVT